MLLQCHITDVVLQKDVESNNFIFIIFGAFIYRRTVTFEKRNYPPGQHGNNRRRGKKSEYAIQLMEKQKAKYT